ncbi:fibrinogen-like protein 1 [Drosophila kikkawai]|uniref:Fibrinogen-like protein 1 n=1 Tax=Drosophila kikkawai TaxID=30033 RepID=A0A6P4I906_DROKI|nr:fibrinogen-like protein 1 [Drosophila kikkawai]
MRPVDNLNNLSQEPGGSALESTTENNSESSDSDMEVLGNTDGDQKRIIQSLKRKNLTKISDLAAKLIIVENNLASEKEKTKDKEDVIKSLKLSIDLLKDNTAQSLKITNCDQHKAKIDELIADIEILECKLKSRNEKISELEDRMEENEINLIEKDEQIANLESQIKVSLDTTQKYENDLKDKDVQIAKLESQAKADAAKIKNLENNLSRYTLQIHSSDDNSNSRVYLNCTKLPLIQFVKLPNGSRFAAVFEDLPKAGPGWMLIQRRIDGSVELFGDSGSNYNEGFGDLSREFWLGSKKLNELTTNQRYELYIELVDFDNATAYARYDNFVVGSHAEDYTLTSLGQYSGNAGDCLRRGVSCKFLWQRQEHNGYTRQCNSQSINERIGWWNNTDCNLNGKYYNCKTILKSVDGIWWGLWNMNQRHSLKSCKMLIRPKP